MTYKEIPLSKGFVTIVDEADYEWLNQWKWSYVKGYAHRTVHNGYDNGKQKFTHIQMHRLIMGAPRGMQVDHIDGNRSNNKRDNLRICNPQQNRFNLSKAKGKSSVYKGVTFNAKRGLWFSKITANKKVYFLGSFADESEAAMAYNDAALKYHGEFAKLNIFYDD